MRTLVQAHEALRRAKFKFPGRQKIVDSRNWCAPTSAALAERAVLRPARAGRLQQLARRAALACLGVWVRTLRGGERDAYAAARRAGASQSSRATTTCSGRRMAA